MEWGQTPMAPGLRDRRAEGRGAMKRTTIGILASVMGSAFAVWWTRRHRAGQQAQDYAAMAEGII